MSTKSSLSFIINLINQPVHHQTQSDTIIKICKIHNFKHKHKLNRPPQQDPYQIPRKSYSRGKRKRSETTLSFDQFKGVSKKLKREKKVLPNNEGVCFQKRRLVIGVNRGVGSEFFCGLKGNENEGVQQKQILIFNKLPVSVGNIKKGQQKENKYEIQIIDNQNKKQKIYINNPVLKQPHKHAQTQIPNPVNTLLRLKYFHHFKFINDYKNGYAPIQLQKQGQEEELLAINTSQQEQLIRKHFIRKKQSALALPKTCGVSYIKKTQSTHNHLVKLPPLIFQCSSECNIGNGSLIDDDLVLNLLKEPMLCIVNKQENMRNILIGQQIGYIFGLRRFDNLYKLFKDGRFILIFPGYLSTKSHMFYQYSKAQIKFGFLIKKGASGKKAVFKSLGLKIPQVKKNTPIEKEVYQQKINTNSTGFESKPEQKSQCESKDEFEEKLQKMIPKTTNIQTLNIKFQIYVNQAQWKHYSIQEKDYLNVLALKLNKVQTLLTRFEKQAAQILKNKILQKKDEQLLIQQAINEQAVEIEPSDAGNSYKQKIRNILFLNHKEHKYLNKPQCFIQKQNKLPFYYISTRDSFAFDLVQKCTTLTFQNRTFLKTQYFFKQRNAPKGYQKNYKDWNWRVGITTYNHFFNQSQLTDFQNQTYKTQIEGFKSTICLPDYFLQMTAQPTVTQTKIRRTKFFFGYRYMWTKQQLAQPYSFVAAGVRRDVSQPPRWTKKIEQPLVDAGIIQKNFINSIAINVYHDGKEGLAQHFDDAVRFKQVFIIYQPIFTLRLFSDARLSFGSQYYGFCNGAFIIPLLRGCICVMQQGSYAANGVKHCVRPCDMQGKSAAVILRQMHEQVVGQADKYDEMIDFPSWLSTMSNDEKGVSYSEQKKIQVQQLVQK